MTDWHELVSRAEQVNLAISEADVNRTWLYGGPSPGADPAELATLDAVLGGPLAPDYQQFLTISNGWDGFYSDVDLFGCADFPFSPPLAFVWMMIDAIEEGSGGLVSYPWSSWIPIGVSREECDFFLLQRPLGNEPGGAVVWLSAGQEVERYDTFAEFFEAMIAFNEANLAEVRTDPLLGAR